MNAIEPLATCRWCGQPIGMFPGDSAPAWVHTGERGAFPCRDRVTGLCLTTYATPTTPPDGATGRRYRVEPRCDTSGPREEPPPDLRARRVADPASGHDHTPTGPTYRNHRNHRSRHRRTPTRTLRPRYRARRALTVLLPARLRRRRPRREHSLRRLHAALDVPALG